MKHNYDHIDPNFEPGKGPEDFFRHLQPPFEKSREEVWDQLSSRIEEKKPAGKLIQLSVYKLVAGIAASILILLGVFSLMRFYTSTVECPQGQHLAYALPDGSTIQMNASSTLKYHPLWWRFSRTLDFEGEAYFEVMKGKKFEVRSESGTTTVLGTSFNIFSRENVYKVTCFTGKVKVTSPTDKEVVLNPDYKAEIDQQGNIMVAKEQKPSADIAWINNMFNFNGRPLMQVLEEIGRQYNVTIEFPSGINYYYTGYFSKDKNVEEVLTLVCKPFGLTFVRLSDKSFKIIQN